VKVNFKKLHPDAEIPKYATLGSAGFDLVAVEDVFFLPNETHLVKTGLAVEIPFGFEMQVRPRSGLSLRTPLRVANSPGTVDADFRGEVCVIMTSTTLPESHLAGKPRWKYEIKKGDRIAQGVICPIVQAEFVEVGELTDTERGNSGFGSTGK
jgi:dUTP pyrophosphatase